MGLRLVAWHDGGRQQQQKKNDKQFHFKAMQQQQSQLVYGVVLCATPLMMELL